MLDHAAQTTGCPHLGLELGRRSGLDALGLLGQIAQAAPDLGSALRFFILHLHDPGAFPLLWEGGAHQSSAPWVRRAYLRPWAT
jgi:hypothetical protein